MEDYEAGLRCQDVHAGLRNVDSASGALSTVLETKLVGMAASLASYIRGWDVVSDAGALQAVAAEHLDVDFYAFKEVISLLEEVGVLGTVKRDGKGRLLSFTESVPFHRSLYTDLGSAWKGRDPSQLEQELVAVVGRLAQGPIPREGLVEEIGVDAADVPRLLDLGSASHLIKSAASPGGTLIYSPFYAFENPKVMSEIVAKHGSDRLAEEFERIRVHQGLPIDSVNLPALADAVRHGLVMAPAVDVPGGRTQPFAALPYVLDGTLLRGRKTVLEKALAVIACLRAGQYFGGYSSLTEAQVLYVIDKFLDPHAGALRPHSSSERQYKLMHRAGLVAYDPDPMPGGNWVVPRFISTEENKEALQIARDLLEHGESMRDRLGTEATGRILGQNGAFSAPIQTVARYRAKAPLDEKSYGKLVEAAMGYGPR
ncbi:MAG: hypothetical protein KC619_04010 [Myxococcales bacterium]|nr:hypothetical protein [Myxococcales bacterium]